MTGPCIQPRMIAACASIVVSFSALAQPAELIVPLDPRTVFDDAREAYSQSIWAERVTVVVHLDDGTERAGEFVVRVEQDPDGSIRVLRLELGPLTLTSNADRTLVTHDRDDQSVLESATLVDDPGTGIRAMLPPIAIPQFDLLAGRRPFDHDLGPAERVHWISAELSDELGYPLVTVTGRTESGTAVLIADAETGRLRSFTAPIPADTPTRIEIRFRLVPPGDSSEWMIDADGRERAGSLAELVQRKPETPDDH